MTTEIKLENIKFDERYDDNGETTLYFIAPKEMLDNFFPKGKYPDAVSMEISIEVPTNNIKAENALVSVSPTIKTEDAYEDCDWIDVDIPLEEIEALLRKAGI